MPLENRISEPFPQNGFLTINDTNAVGMSGRFQCILQPTHQLPVDPLGENGVLNPLQFMATCRQRIAKYLKQILGLRFRSIFHEVAAIVLNFHGTPPTGSFHEDIQLGVLLMVIVIAQFSLQVRNHVGIHETAFCRGEFRPIDFKTLIQLHAGRIGLGRQPNTITQLRLERRNTAVLTENLRIVTSRME